MRNRLSLFALLCALCVTPLALAAGQPLVAVLDFRVTDLKLSAGELGLLTEGARKVAVERLGDTYGIITRENLQDLLGSHGKTLEKCQGACETETGRMLGAELVVTGHITRAFGELHLTMKTHRTDPPTLLATELGKTTSRNKLPDLTARVCRALLDPIAGGLTGVSEGARPSTPTHPPAPSWAKLFPQAPTRVPKNNEASDPFRITPLVEGYPMPSLGWVAFKGALRDESVDREQRKYFQKHHDEASRQLQRSTGGTERPRHLKNRIVSSFYLNLLRTTKTSSQCWAQHVRSGEKTPTCSKNIEVESTTGLRDLEEFLTLRGLKTSELPDDLLFIAGYTAWSNGEHEPLRRAGARLLEEQLVPKDHVDSLLLVGHQMLMDGDTYNAARLLTRALHRTDPEEPKGAFARYLLAWVYMSHEHLGGVESLTAIPDEHGKTATQRWGTDVSTTLFSEFSEALIHRKRWTHVEKTAPALIKLLQQEQDLNEDHTNWVGPIPEGIRPDQVN